MNNDSIVLIVDNDRSRAEELQTLLLFMEQGAATLTDSDQLHRHLEHNPNIEVVFMGRPDSNGQLVEQVESIHRRAPTLPVVLVEEADRVDSGLPPGLNLCSRLMRPFHHHRLERVLQQVKAYRRLRQPLPGRQGQDMFRSLVGVSRPLERLREMIERVAPTEATVLIAGESGTGKEVVANNLHYFSLRSKGPFVPVNCGAIPHELLESELFGHEKGAFTGALAARRGRFELAEGGTLFLDEIGDMPMDMQVKLLRVLQERTFERVGSGTPINANVRIIAATHRNLEELVEKGRFREDLYYRLCVFPIEVPALRERSEDLPLLAEELCARMEREQGSRVQLTERALEVLARHTWPGNVRELANLIERLTILYPGERVDVARLPAKFRPGELANDTGGVPLSGPETAGIRTGTEFVGNAVAGTPLRAPNSLPQEGLDLKDYLEELESRLIRSALSEANGVISHAAELLKLRRTTLTEKMRKYGLRRESV